MSDEFGSAEPRVEGEADAVTHPAADRLAEVIKQAKHQAEHNAPCSPGMIRELQDIHDLLAG